MFYDTLSAPPCFIVYLICCDHCGLPVAIFASGTLARLGQLWRPAGKSWETYRKTMGKSCDVLINGGL